MNQNQSINKQSSKSRLLLQTINNYQKNQNDETQFNKSKAKAIQQIEILYSQSITNQRYVFPKNSKINEPLHNDIDPKLLQSGLYNLNNQNENSSKIVKTEPGKLMQSIFRKDNFRSNKTNLSNTFVMKKYISPKQHINTQKQEVDKTYLQSLLMKIQTIEPQSSSKQKIALITDRNEKIQVIKNNYLPKEEKERELSQSRTNTYYMGSERSKPGRKLIKTQSFQQSSWFANKQNSYINQKSNLN